MKVLTNLVSTGEKKVVVQAATDLRLVYNRSESYNAECPEAQSYNELVLSDWVDVYLVGLLGCQ